MKPPKRPTRWLLTGSLYSAALHFSERMITLGGSVMLVDPHLSPWVAGRLKKHGERAWLWNEYFPTLRVERRMNAVEYSTGIVLIGNTIVTQSVLEALVRIHSEGHWVPPTVLVTESHEAKIRELPSGLPITALHCSELYGEAPWDGWLLGLCADAVLKGKVDMGGSATHSVHHELVAADDVAIAIESAATHIGETQGKIFEVGGGVDNVITETMLGEQLLILGRRYGIPLTINSVIPDAAAELQPTDSSEFRRITGWVPKISQRQGLERLFLWCRAHRAELEAYQ